MKLIKYIPLFLFAYTLNSEAFELTAGLTPPAQQKTFLGLSGTFYEASDFPTETAQTKIESADISTPVYKTDSESYTVTANYSQFSINPKQSSFAHLYDVKIGAGYTRVVDEQRMWSVFARYGSASDRPFEANDVSTLGVTGFYSVPSDDPAGKWLLLVDYSNNRPILNNLPLPGFAYFYTPSKEFRAVLGIPFASVNWTYSEKYTLEVFTLVPWIVKVSTSYAVTPFAKLYTGFNFSQSTYYLYGREDKQERLFYDDKKVFVGAKSPISKTIFADLELGYAFDRAFFEAENYEISPDNETKIGNSAYGRLTLRFIL
ncbi:hypothetical protein ACES2L_07045 [Bdellovibrio bacteriovorus]